MLSSLIIALLMLGQVGGAGDGSPQGDIVNINYDPPPSVSYVPLYRAVKIITEVEVAACPIPPEVPNEENIFPEAIFMQAHRVRFRDGVVPEALDLRAFAVFQRRYPAYRGFISGLPCTYTIESAVTGQHPLVLRHADPNKAAFRWIRGYIRPPTLPDTWCDFDKDHDVDLFDYRAFFDRWFTRSSIAGGGDDGGD